MNTMGDIGESMIRGAEEALAFAVGETNPENYQIHIRDEIEVKRIRVVLDREPEAVCRALKKAALE